QHCRFPGAQPVSFTSESLEQLCTEDFYVAEKSDGVRCLGFITTDKNRHPKLFLIDRKSKFFVVDVWFPNPAKPDRFIEDTIVDGEFVNDVQPGTNEVVLRFLLFDCLIAGGKSLVDRDFSKRLGYLKEIVLKPYQKMLANNPAISSRQPFRIEFKEQYFTHRLDTVFSNIIPNLRHGNDGLIFTAVNEKYMKGTSMKTQVWKPANENSVDFRVRLKTEDSRGDRRAKPIIELYAWHGNDGYRFYDVLGITDKEWRDNFSKLSFSQLDGHIIECNYDVHEMKELGLPSAWRFMRFRDDKPEANYITTIEKVMASIRDGVSKEDLIAAIPRIKDGWDKRNGKNLH
ncbi:mRNA capping enzyme, catalytic domain-containing protein, partial [Dichotomocladium elegans]